MQKEIVCFGDSNTYGLVPGQKERYPRDIRWTGLLESSLCHKGYHVIEEGLCGRTTVFEDALRDHRKGSDMLPAILECHKPIDLIILMLGTNDCKSYYHASADVIGLGIEKLLEQIRSQLQNVRILLISPIHLGNDVWKEEFDPEFDIDSVKVSKELKKVYHNIAVRYEIDFLAASEHASASEADQQHLNETGHRNLAEAILRKLNTEE
ncbi:MAG: GDSL-type esterase/lipase family protein [Hespellia sp.]|nr:GDSL-type esterase/lipase family protein [Hespellia sp.]